VVGKRLVARCEAVDLAFGTILCEADDDIENVYFPLSGFMSLVGVVHGHKPLELGLIGNEGMLGATLVLSVESAPLRCIVQGSGSALRMDIAQFQWELQRSAALRLVLNRYLYVLMTQLFQTTTCVCFHEVEARLARWLLMSHDRAHADHFHLTHEFLANMLGVRRSGVTKAAGALQTDGLIRYSRGEITIVDRAGLEAASCECYAQVIKDYAWLLH
jgi:CRP-like cAMP-binding protein